MSPEAQRIAIAEACGFMATDMGYIEPVYQRGDEECFASELPDYLNDLNAMREAVLTLLFSKRKEYRIKLREVCSRVLSTGGMLDISECIDATAAQRAEAFLKAIGKWSEP